MKLVSSKPMGKRRVYDIEVADVHNFYANGVNVHNCATDGGVSVIKNDGTVVDIVFTSSNVTTAIDFDEQNNVLFLHGGNANLASYWRKYAIPTTDLTGQSLTSGGLASYASNTIPSRGDLPAIYPITRGIVANKALGANNKLAFLDEDLTTQANGMIAYTTSDYNTGWMNGDIKLATLSDTDDTDLVGTELVTNGTFDTDTSGWTVYGTATTPTIEWDNGELLITMNGNATGAAFNIATEVGKTYYVELDITSISSGNAQFRWDFDDNQRQFTAIPKTIKGYYVATRTTTPIHIGANQDMQFPSTIKVDNVSVRLAESDRSVNNNGLQVFGTVTREPVATGADLVGYKFISNGLNYLSQPYNPDLDFGTSDFCLMGWIKTTDGYCIIFDNRNSLMSTGISLEVYPEGSTSKMRLYLQSVMTNSVEIPEIISGTWCYFCAVRKGDTVYFYANGTLRSSVTNSTIENQEVLKSDTSPMLISVRHDGQQALEGSLALLRISGTAPTAEQVAKIYRDEKPLFQEGAQATLYGTSDAVTALAYDDTTELLHVGTSAGRSVFQGLERVDNTTDAVGTAISASNGLVVEE